MFSMIFVKDNKRAGFCHESLAVSCCYLIVCCCKNSIMLFAAAMWPDLATMSEKHDDKAGWCITAGSCVSSDKDNSSHILSEDNVLTLTDNKGMLSLASAPHYSNLIWASAAQGAVLAPHTTFKASRLEITASAQGHRIIAWILQMLH